MGNLGDIFEKRVNQLGIKKQVDAALVVQESQDRLKEIFGADVEKNLQVISFNNGTLKIAARTNAWANESQAQILKIRKNPIERIVFTTTFPRD
jgi:hypothetical protein